MEAMFNQRVFRYAPLKHGRDRTNKVFNYNKIPSAQGLIALTILAITVIGSFLAGRYSVTQGEQAIPQLSVRSEVFKYDRTFGEAHSNASNAAWMALFPIQGGFFKHPTIAPRRSAFSVFHQLHCLDGIRRGYWVVHDAAMEGRAVTDEELPFMASPPHIRHCIDLLRHRLMCQPDLTVEVKDKELGGVTGFGTLHQCRDWDQLIDWTSKWEAYQQDPRNGKSDKETAAHEGHGSRVMS